jgi:2-polyprenyl-6-methoxyphenol hydroxylase-like FAD-dependent oxidoreductase
MFGRGKPEVLVAGAGPVGLTTALALARNGVAVRVVDAAWRPAAQSYSLALHPASLTLLDGLGLAGRVLDEAVHVRRIGFFDRGGRRVALPLHGLNEDYSFVAVLPQARLERLLEEALREEGVEVQWSHRAAGFEQTGEAVRVRVDRMVKESVGYSVAHTEWVVAGTKHLDVPFVIGADGHRSLVRRALGTAFEEAGPSQAFAIFECDAPGAGDEMQLVMGTQAVSVLWPLPGQRARWSLELAAPDVSAADRYKSRLTTRLGERYFPYLDEARTRELLRERAPWFEKAAGPLGWSVEVRFERRLAGCFGAGRVWLAGDAAHLTGPVGMQSMNSGLAEARDLAARIARIHEGRADLDLLASHGSERREQWEFLLGRQGRLRPTPSAPPFIARNASRLLSCLPATGDELALLADQIGLVVERG